ncbi:hypothetical protein Tco_0008513 [Tanacetum coccineum]
MTSSKMCMTDKEVTILLNTCSVSGAKCSISKDDELDSDSFCHGLLEEEVHKNTDGWRCLVVMVGVGGGGVGLGWGGCPTVCVVKQEGCVVGCGGVEVKNSRWYVRVLRTSSSSESSEHPCNPTTKPRRGSGKVGRRPAVPPPREHKADNRRAAKPGTTQTTQIAYLKPLPQDTPGHGRRPHSASTTHTLPIKHIVDARGSTALGHRTRGPTKRLLARANDLRHGTGRPMGPSRKMSMVDEQVCRTHRGQKKLDPEPQDSPRTQDYHLTYRGYGNDRGSTVENTNEQDKLENEVCIRTSERAHVSAAQPETSSEPLLTPPAPRTHPATRLLEFRKKTATQGTPKSWKRQRKRQSTRKQHISRCPRAHTSPARRGPPNRPTTPPTRRPTARRPTRPVTQSQEQLADCTLSTPTKQRPQARPEHTQDEARCLKTYRGSVKNEGHPGLTTNVTRATSREGHVRHTLPTPAHDQLAQSHPHIQSDQRY